MKIIFTTHTYLPFNNGVSTTNAYLAEGLHAKGYEVLVITHSHEGLPKEETINGVRIIRQYDGNAEQYIKCVKDNVTEEDVLINVCVQTPTTDLLLPILDTIPAKKKILYIHGIWHFGWTPRDKASFHNVGSKIYNNLKWRCYYYKNAKNFKKYDIVTQLHEMDDGNIFFKKHYGINSIIMENAADEAFFQKEDDSLFLEKYNLPKEYLVCVANYGPLKNQELVLRAYYHSNADLEMVFVGSDKSGYIDHLKQIEKELQAEGTSQVAKKVRYYNDIPRDEIAPFVRNATVFLFGSVGEKFPISIVEPMAAGVPFISTDVGIVRYLPGGKTVHGEAEMFKTINKVVFDVPFRLELAKAGREHALVRMRVQERVTELEDVIKH
jgi:glycosyltransferase involved in cell wall biosynthesis